jgi:hypothetical protein
MSALVDRLPTLGRCCFSWLTYATIAALPHQLELDL